MLILPRLQAGIAHRYNLCRRTAPSSQLIEHAEAKSSKLSRKERKALDDHRARVAVGKRTDNDNFSFMAQHKSDDRVKANRAARSALAVHAIGDAAGNLAVIFDGAMSWMLGPKSGVISGRESAGLGAVRKPAPASLSEKLTVLLNIAEVTYWKGIGYVDPICTLVVM